MKKIIFFLLIIQFFNCKTENNNYKIIDVSEERTQKLKENNVEEKWVLAKSGLNYRKTPKGEILGKFEFGEKLEVIKQSNIFESIKDGKKLIYNEWLGVKRKGELDIKYVFGGFLANEKQFEKIKKNLTSKKEISIPYSHENLIGKKFFIYDEENNIVNDASFTKGSDLRFYKDHITEVEVMENRWFEINSYSFENDFLIYNKEKYSKKFKYNKSKGILTEYTKDYTVKYIDSIVLFKKGSKIKYKYITESTFPDKDIIDYRDFRKNTIKTTDNTKKIYSEWIEDNLILLDSVVGDINKDNIQDRIYFTVDEDFSRANDVTKEFEVKTLILLGTNNKDLFKLYHKSKTIVPGYFDKYGTNYKEQPFWGLKLEKGILEFYFNYEDREGLAVTYYFEFEYKKEEVILTKISKILTTRENEFNQTVNLPKFDLTIQDFDVYKFIDVDYSSKF